MRNSTDIEMRDALRIPQSSASEATKKLNTKAGAQPDAAKWLDTENRLRAVAEKFSAIHETPQKEHTAAQIAQLIELRKQAAAIGYERYSLLAQCLQ